MIELYQIAAPLSARYAPYNSMPEFWCGFREYIMGRKDHDVEFTGVDQQAYDRGAELGMIVSRG